MVGCSQSAEAQLWRASNLVVHTPWQLEYAA